MKFQEIVEKYDLIPCQVYYMDEIGLNYKMQLNKMLAALNDTVAGTKLLNDRLPLLFAATLMVHTSFLCSLLVNLRSLRRLKTKIYLPCQFIIAIKNLLGWIAIFLNLGLSINSFHLLKKT